MLRRCLASASLVLLTLTLAPLPSASANHPQAAHGDVVVFDHKTGNEWWVELLLSGGASGSVASVQAMDTGGPWVTLTKRSWGAWAASFHVEPGHQVMFRVSWPGGETLGSCWFDHPSGVERCGTPPPPPRFGADFRNVKGNEWWVEATVLSREPLAGVDARLGCSGTWMPLTLRSWGSWAASFRVFPGTHVDFRARATNGLQDLSDNAYVWPQATPTDACDAPWPRDSSFAHVRFRVEDRWTDVDGEHYRKADGLVSTRFSRAGGGFWDGTCEQRVTTRSPAGAWSNVTQSFAWDAVPPFGQVPATVGGAADVQQVENCALTHVLDQQVVARERRAFSIRTSSGDPVPIDAYHATDSGTGFDESWWWDAKHGLMLDWDLDSFGSGNTRHADGWLQNTDAKFT